MDLYEKLNRIEKSLEALQEKIVNKYGYKYREEGMGRVINYEKHVKVLTDKIFKTLFDVFEDSSVADISEGDNELGVDIRLKNKKLFEEVYEVLEKRLNPSDLSYYFYASENDPPIIVEQSSFKKDKNRINIFYIDQSGNCGTSNCVEFLVKVAYNCTKMKRELKNILAQYE